jgi:hypothetical protein
MRENIGAAAMKLSSEELRTIEQDLIAAGSVNLAATSNRDMNMTLGFL